MLPHELIYKENPIHTYKVNPLNQAYINIRNANELNNNKTNKLRKKFCFEIGMKLIIKTFRKTKTKDRFKGPYTILDISRDKNGLRVENDKEILSVNIKNVRISSKEGLNVVTQHD
ncbi:hypothetical protein DMUE_3919 [Dictyocoela muelleri]|nr:hypothetical protein DMUE_3919 [Dictyocoela muelleri]